MEQKEAAILFITFNRTDTTRVVFETIKKAKPKKFYFFSDGAREKNFEDDRIKILENRKLTEQVDWDCRLETRFMDENQGCGAGVSGAISWAFETEEKLIILEDDCLPSSSFFGFCNEMLNRYASNPRIMHIAGTRWNEEFPINDSDFFYTIYGHIWGWATWKRAWQLYDFTMKDWQQFQEKKILNIIFCDDAALIKRWTLFFNNIYQAQKKHTWDYQWQYAMFKNNGLSINVVKNLVTNIGTDGMHTQEETTNHNRERHELQSPLRVPLFLYPEYGFDAYHGRKFFLQDRSDLKILYDRIEDKIPFLKK